MLVFIKSPSRDVIITVPTENQFLRLIISSHLLSEHAHKLSQLSAAAALLDGSIYGSFRHSSSNTYHQTRPPNSRSKRGPVTTPVSSNGSSRSAKRRRFGADSVLDAMNESPVAPRPRHNFYPPAAPPGYSTPNHGVYQPNQSLYEGPFHRQESDGSDVENYPPLDNCQTGNLSLAELVKTIQEQQHLLQEVIENQKKMESKQEDFDNKLDDLTKRSESSCSSPDKQNKRKFKIKRTLTVSECHLISNFIFFIEKSCCGLRQP